MPLLSHKVLPRDLHDYPDANCLMQLTDKFIVPDTFSSVLQQIDKGFIIDIQM